MNYSKTLDKLRANRARQQALLSETDEHIAAIEKLAGLDKQQDLLTQAPPAAATQPEKKRGA